MKQDWLGWIDRLKSTRLTKTELRDFEAELSADPSRMDSYLDALLTETMLEARNPAPARRARNEAPRLRVGLAVAAGLAVLAAASSLVMLSRRSGDAKGNVAVVTATDARGEAGGLGKGQSLASGKLEVGDESLVHLQMDGGAELEVRGPATLQLRGADRIFLNRGRVLAYVPERARGFTIDTEDGTVVDLGTQFVATADKGTGTEVHVIEGLVRVTPAGGGAVMDLTKHRASRLKDRSATAIRFERQRFELPLAGKNPGRADVPPPEVEESFVGYEGGVVEGRKSTAAGIEGSWAGHGRFVDQGLSYQQHGRALEASGGSLRTDELQVGDWFQPSAEDCTASPVYVSFLMKLPPGGRPDCFSGLLLYRGEIEELFVGKIAVAGAFGSRFRMAEAQESFEMPMDDRTHLFVIRIDREQRTTEVFMDPDLGAPEQSQQVRARYPDVPVFDRIMLRSGNGTVRFSAAFDEIRLGRSWASVLPLMR